jgi:hypothetical protein
MVRVTHLFSFLCFVFCFGCVCLVSCVLNVSSFSGLSILDCHFGFFNFYSMGAICLLSRSFLHFTKHRKLKRWATRIPSHTRGELGCSQRLSSSSLLQDTHHITHLVKTCYACYDDVMNEERTGQDHVVPIMISLIECLLLTRVPSGFIEVITSIPWHG